MKLRRYLIEKAQRNPIVYHGTYHSDIKNFSTKRKRSETGVRHFGSYFTDSIEMSRTFGKYIYKVQLKKENYTRYKKIDKVYGECLGSLRRRRTCKAALSLDEPPRGVINRGYPNGETWSKAI